jgi:hypothetical protein
MQAKAPEGFKLTIASPCTVSWDSMSGDERCRFCSMCRKNVYNLSSMTGPEAQALIRERQGNICVRFYQRTDGTVLTEDCPVGLAAIRKKVRDAFARATTAALALFGATAGVNFLRTDSRVASVPVTNAAPIQVKPTSVVVAPPAPPAPPIPMMGDPVVGGGAAIVPHRPEPMPELMGKIAMPDPVVKQKPTKIKEPLITKHPLMGHVSQPMMGGIRMPVSPPAKDKDAEQGMLELIGK